VLLASKLLNQRPMAQILPSSKNERNRGLKALCILPFPCTQVFKYHNNAFQQANRSLVQVCMAQFPSQRTNNKLSWQAFLQEMFSNLAQS